MKLLSMVRKSLKEQVRHFWILILTASMAPIFVLIYYAFTEVSKTRYDVLILNQDRGVEGPTGAINHGEILIETVKALAKGKGDIPVTIRMANQKGDAIQKLKKRKADALVRLPESFSERIQNLSHADEHRSVDIEFTGDLTNINYIICAIWAQEALSEYVLGVTNKPKLITIREEGLGVSSKVDDFDLYIPGILILSIIMLMFSATIAIITEVENKTIIRLKLSTVSSFQLLTGISLVQVVVGIVSILLTLLVAVWLGFSLRGSFGLLLVIAVLTSISIIAFSLILAAFTRTVNEVLIVGNFPLFLFMFFSGAAFPMKGKELFSFAGYSFTIQGLMSPAHSISALKKILIMNMGFSDVLPEIFFLTVITLIYFGIGVWAFQRRHMKVA